MCVKPYFSIIVLCYDLGDPELAGEIIYLWVLQEELENVAGERDVWNTLLSLSPPHKDKQEKMDVWMDQSAVWSECCLLIKLRERLIQCHVIPRYTSITQAFGVLLPCIGFCHVYESYYVWKVNVLDGEKIRRWGV